MLTERPHAITLLYEVTLRDTLAGLPIGLYPLTADVAAHLGGYGISDNYALVLDHLLVGIRASAGPTVH